MPKSKRLQNVLADIPPNSDSRGEAVKIMTMQKTGWAARDIVAISTNPGVTRGNHYHKKKEEIFVLLKGRMKVVLVDVESNERLEFTLGEKKKQMLFIHPYVAHSLKNVGSETAWFVEVQDTDYDDGDDYKIEM